MTSRRTSRILGPTAAIAAAACGLVASCMPWTLDMPGAASFVSRGLTEAYGIALTSTGKTEVSLLPLPRIGFSDVRLTADDWAGPVLADGGNLTVQLSLASLLLGRAEPVSLSLDGTRVSLPSSDDDRRWAGPMRRLARTLAGDETGHPRRVTLTHATVSGRDPRDGHAETARDVDLALSWPLWSEQAALAGRFTWNGASARFLLSSLRPAAILAGRESPFSVTVNWPAGSLNADGRGTFVDGAALTGQGKLETRSLPETLAWIGGDVGLSPLLEAFAIEGSFETSRDGVRLPTVRVSAGSTTLEGAGSVELNGRRPSIRATLDASDLNLAPALAGLLRVTGIDGEDGWSRQPLGLAPLTGGDLDLRLSGGRARLGPIVLENLASSVIVRADGIDVTLGRANLHGGILKGRLALFGRAGSGSDETEVKAQGSFDGIDLGAFLVDLGQNAWLDGPGRGSFSFDGRGGDAMSLARALKGRAVLSMQEGAIAGLDLADVIHRGGAVAHGALARRNGRTTFERAAVSMIFDGGLGEIEDGGLTAHAVSGRLLGRVSLPDRSIAAHATLTPRKGVSEAVPPGASTIFEISGPWNAVTVRTGSHGEIADPTDSVARAPLGSIPNLPTQVRAYAP